MEILNFEYRKFLPATDIKVTATQLEANLNLRQYQTSLVPVKKQAYSCVHEKLKEFFCCPTSRSLAIIHVLSRS